METSSREVAQRPARRAFSSSRGACGPSGVSCAHCASASIELEKAALSTSGVGIAMPVELEPAAADAIEGTPAVGAAAAVGEAEVVLAGAAAVRSAAPMLMRAGMRETRTRALAARASISVDFCSVLEAWTWAAGVPGARPESSCWKGGVACANALSGAGGEREERGEVM